MDERAQRVAELLHEAAEVHHVVYRISDGADDDWASFYAHWLTPPLRARRGAGLEPGPQPSRARARRLRPVTRRRRGTVGARLRAPDHRPLRRLKPLRPVAHDLPTALRLAGVTCTTERF